MTTQEILDFFHLLMDDTSDLSTSEELILANQVYRSICIKPYEFLKKEDTGAISSTEITLPTDFMMIPDNVVDNYSPKKIYIDKKTYDFVNFSDRRDYEDKIGYCYLDLNNNKIVFTKSTTGTYSYDYIFIPESLTLTDTPNFPVCNEIISYGMAISSYIIQQFPRAQSYQRENQIKFETLLTDLDYYNSNLININL